MKIILGIDSEQAYKPALTMLAKLRPAQRDMVLLHAAEVDVPALATPVAAVVQTEYSRAVENVGIRALDLAMDDACAHDFRARCRLAFGRPAGCLIAEAEAADADLVAVNATHRGVWSSSFLGSVSRALTIGCPTSVLVTKGDRAVAPTPTLVLATDHSDYAERWIDRFLTMRLTGVAHIHVVTAYQIDDHLAEVLHRNLPTLGGFVDEYVEERLGERGAALVARLQAAGYSADFNLVKKPTNDAIRETMRNTKADLLVVGAQGHGFVERLMVGSISLHQVVAEPYPVMVVRA